MISYYKSYRGLSKRTVSALFFNLSNYPHRKRASRQKNKKPWTTTATQLRNEVFLKIPSCSNYIQMINTGKPIQLFTRDI